MRKSTPRGSMTRGANSGPAVMLMPSHIRATFMPNPPLRHIPTSISVSNNSKKRRKANTCVLTGVSQYLELFEKTSPPERIIQPTPKEIKQKRTLAKMTTYKKEKLEPQIEQYRQEQRTSNGEYEGMNCYNTLFVGRLAYEVTERKLLREMEVFGPIKDIKIVKNNNSTPDGSGTAGGSGSGSGMSRGYGFIEYEHEDDMKRAYRGADGMRIENRDIVVDVERGHTVPSWLPRRLSGGLGGTRLGGKHINVTRPGRYDPNRPDAPAGGGVGASGAAGGMGRGAPGPPPSQHPPYGMGRGGGGGGGFGGFRDGGGGPPPPPPMMASSSSSSYGGRGRGGGGGPGGGPGDWYGSGGSGWDRGGGGASRYGDSRGAGGGDYRKRQRSPSPPDRRYADRRPRRY